MTSFLVELQSRVDDLALSDNQAYNKVKANDTGIVSPIGDHDIVYRFDK